MFQIKHLKKTIKIQILIMLILLSANRIHTDNCSMHETLQEWSETLVGSAAYFMPSVIA